MVFLNELLKKKSLLSTFLILILILISGTTYCSTLSFDEYAVFCSYFKISGDEPSDQDIEELCFTFQRPTYTSFKASEMFTKKSLLRERKIISKRIEAINDDSTYSWKVRRNISSYKDIEKYFSMASINKMLPQPTPYINSRISGKGQRKLKKAISSLMKKYPEKIKKKDVEIIITLKPEKFESKYQKRNIVKQHVVLPIRYVIFQPKEVQILDELETVK